jgi:hypothetical protein
LSNALNFAFSLSVAMQSEIEQFNINSNNFVRHDFEYELQALCMQMMGEIMVVMAQFLVFSSTNIYGKAHNMLVLMLDLCFKSLNVVKDFVRKAKVIQMLVEYDNTSLMHYWFPNLESKCY